MGICMGSSCRCERLKSGPWISSMERTASLQAGSISFVLEYCTCGAFYWIWCLYCPGSGSVFNSCFGILAAYGVGMCTSDTVHWNGMKITLVHVILTAFQFQWNCCSNIEQQQEWHQFETPLMIPVNCSSPQNPVYYHSINCA